MPGTVTAQENITSMSILIFILGFRASLLAQMVKSLPAMQETWVQSLGREVPLEKEIATHSSSLAWKNPMDGGGWWATVHGVTNSQT